MSKRLKVAGIFILLPIVAFAQGSNFDSEWSKSFAVELNNIRKMNGLPELEYSILLSRQSYAYSKSMSRRFKGQPQLEHAQSHWLFIKLYDGECISYGDDPLNQWLNSLPHRRIMMDRSMKKIGVSCYGEYCTLRVKRD